MKYSFTLNILVYSDNEKTGYINITDVLKDLEVGKYNIETVNQIDGNPTCILKLKDYEK